MVFRITGRPRYEKGEIFHSGEDIYVLGRQENDL